MDNKRLLLTFLFLSTIIHIGLLSIPIHLNVPDRYGIKEIFIHFERETIAETAHKDIPDITNKTAMTEVGTKDNSRGVTPRMSGKTPDLLSEQKYKKEGKRKTFQGSNSETGGIKNTSIKNIETKRQANETKKTSKDVQGSKKETPFLNPVKDNTDEHITGDFLPLKGQSLTLSEDTEKGIPPEPSGPNKGAKGNGGNISHINSYQDTLSESTAGGDSLAKVDTATQIELYRALLGYIIKRHIYYPRIAKKSGIKGKVIVNFLVNQDGTTTDIKVSKTSGYSILDKAAIKIINRASPLPIPPFNELMIEVPIVYSLKED